MHVEAWETEARLAQLRARRKRQARTRLVRRAGLVAVGALALVFVAGIFVYAGSPSRLADGVTIAGVDVGGLSSGQAEALLERRAAAQAQLPLQATAGGRTYRIEASGLGVDVDWRSAVSEAQDRVDGFRPIRGLRRLGVRLFGPTSRPMRRLARRRSRACSTGWRETTTRIGMPRSGWPVSVRWSCLTAPDACSTGGRPTHWCSAPSRPSTGRRLRSPHGSTSRR